MNKEQNYIKVIETPIGNILIRGNDNRICELKFIDDVAEMERYIIKDKVKNDIVNECACQLLEYFSGERKIFDIPLQLDGTAFQIKVWNHLKCIPFGTTVTYGQVAEAIGNNKASRAVGGANNKNRIPIILPCHRVMGSNGKMVGYAGGIWRKEWLLSHEKSEVFL